MKRTRPAKLKLDYERILFNGDASFFPPSKDDIQRLCDIARPHKSGRNSESAIRRACLWDYSIYGLDKRPLSRYQKKAFKKLKDHALSMMDEIESCFLDESLKDVYFSQAPLDENKILASSYEAMQSLISECQNIIRDKTRADVFPEFIFQAAVLFEYVSTERFTSTNADAALATKGERFAQAVCEIISDMTYEYDISTTEEGEPPPQKIKIPAHKIKTACSYARKRLRTYGEKIKGK